MVLRCLFCSKEKGLEIYAVNTSAYASSVAAATKQAAARGGGAGEHKPSVPARDWDRL